MPFKEGDTKPEGSGRKKGQVNKITADVKQAIADSMVNVLRDKKGREKFFTKLAKADPKVYAAVLLKFLPSKIQTEFTVDEDLGAALEAGRRRVIDERQTKTIEVVAEVKPWSPFKTGESE